MNDKISVIIPLHNGARTIKKTLESLFAQSQKFHEVIIIEDGSTDNSLNILKNQKDTRIKIIHHDSPAGLSKTYNEGIKAAKGNLIVTLHQDIILQNDSLEKLVSPFFESNEKNIVATTHIVQHPFEVWNEYNFWQKVYFARLVGKDFYGLDGKFDCFKKEALLQVGLFDEIHFKSAGEDGDMIYKLRQIGEIVQTDAKITHIHNIDPDFGIHNIINKQKQYSEAQGTLLRLGRIKTPLGFLKAFFREILILGLIIPFLNIPSTILILVYSIWYSKAIFRKEYQSITIILVPFLNIYLLFVSYVYSLRGFINAKQTI